MTVSGIGRTPAQPYSSFASAQRLDGVRIGVVREYMNKKLFSKADEQSIDIVERAIQDLRNLGIAATQVTLSRDIRELGLVKTADGYRQIMPEQQGPGLGNMAAEFLVRWPYRRAEE